MKVKDNRGRDREVVLWSCHRDAVHLTCKSISEAVRFELGFPSVSGTIYVYGWARCIQPTPTVVAETILDSAIELMDVNYECGASEETSEITTGMKEAALSFATKFLDEFEVLGCEIVFTMTVDANDALAGKYDQDTNR